MRSLVGRGRQRKSSEVCPSRPMAEPARSDRVFSEFESREGYARRVNRAGAPGSVAGGCAPRGVGFECSALRLELVERYLVGIRPDEERRSKRRSAARAALGVRVPRLPLMDAQSDWQTELALKPGEPHGLAGSTPAASAMLSRLAGCWRLPDKQVEQRSIRWFPTPRPRWLRGTGLYPV